MTKESKTLILVSLLNVLAVVGWVFLLVMLLDKSEVIASKTQQLNQLESNQSELINSRSLLEQTKDSRQLLSQYFYNEDSAVELIESIEVLGRESGVQVSFSDVSTDQDLVLDLEARGGYDQVVDFLGRLEAGPFVAKFERVSFGESGVVDAEGVVVLGGWAIEASLRVISFDK